jgi:excinuclease ABC subunit B
VLVGINLLREGLDLPEVSLVAILDADKEGFLRSKRSLIQTIGRAARHLTGRAILYADRITDSMRAAIDETERRRAKQVTYNLTHGIIPVGIVKEVKDIIDGVAYARPGRSEPAAMLAAEEAAEYESLSPDALARMFNKLEKQMYTHARNLEFEQAAALRNKIQAIKEHNFGVAKGTALR